ncbi:Nitrogen permease regulator 2 [Mortierella sp. NVP85]|nr:Nitrogen permease regulator 2 [Mortierella sp. NVP85]
MGFPRLLSVFYCTFHPIQGPKVLYEVPEGSILSKTSPLVDFESISEFLIPKVEICARLVTISTPTCKVVGFPVNLEHKKFQRNALMFNLAFVFDKDAETSSYEPVVRKMARVLKALEKENEFLSRQTRIAMMDPGSLANPLYIQSAPATPATTSSSMMTIQAARPPIFGTTSAEAVQANGGGNANLETIAEAASALSLNETNMSNASAASGTPSASDTLATSTITSTGLVSSPPSTVGSTNAPVLIAPASSSPFSLSKSSSTSSSNTFTNSSNGTSSAPSSYKGTPSMLLLQGQPDENGMQNLIEQLLEDLNSYCECRIPIDSANIINLKLFPTYPNPPPVYDYQVPISTVNLEALLDVSWDMTMQRIAKYINGVNSVKRIAEYADVETGLARLCMQHLLYYGCIIMVDLFQFKNIYAVKLEMMRLTEDSALQNECVSYDWIEQNQIADYNIDVRRFISFGVIKGFLHRVHKYPILDYFDPASVLGLGPANSSTRTDASPIGAIAPLSNAVVAPPVMTTSSFVTSAPVTTTQGTQSSSSSTHKKVHGDSLASTEQQSQQQSTNETTPSVVIPPALRRMLNGQHHYDELCTMFGCSVREMDQILATDSRVKFIYR